MIYHQVQQLLLVNIIIINIIKIIIIPATIQCFNTVFHDQDPHSMIIGVLCIVLSRSLSFLCHSLQKQIALHKWATSYVMHFPFSISQYI